MPWSVVAAVVGGAIASDTARKNRNQANGASSSNDALAARQFEEDKRRYDLNREDQERWGMMQIMGEEENYQRGARLNRGNVDRGEKAGNQLSYLMGLGDDGTGEKGFLARRFGADDFQKDGGYNFRMAEGQTGVGNQFAQSGNLLSGAAMKALTRFNQDFASNEYDKAYSRFGNDQNSQYNRLAGIQNAGQAAINSTNGLSGNGGGYANIASGLQNASNQLGQSTNNYYNNVMGNNNARANSQSAYNNAFGNSLAGGLGSLSSNWNSYSRNNNNNNYSYPTSNFGGYDDQGF